MATALRELIASFTVGVDDKGLRQLDKNIDTVSGKINKLIELAATGFAFKGIESVFARQIEKAAHVQDLAERLDISATSMKEFGFAAATAGVDFDAAARALGFLEKAQGGALLGQKANAKAFAELGVSVKDASGKAKPLEELLGDVADSFQKLPNQAERAAAATKLFGRAGRDLLPLLDQGGAKIRALMGDAAKLGNGLGDDYYQRAKKAREETLRIGYAFQSLKDRITNAALPGIMSFLEWVEKIETKFLDWTKRTYALETAVAFLAAAGGAKFLVFLFQAAKALGLIKGTALETLGALAGFAAPLALIGALYLAFDDLYTLMEGGKSEIGELLEKFEGPGAAEKFKASMIDAWKDIKASAKDAAKAIGDIFDVDVSGDIAGKAYIKALETIRDVARDTAHELRAVASVLDDLIGKKARGIKWTEPGKIVAQLGQAAADLFERNPGTVDETGGGLRDDRNNRAASGDYSRVDPRTFVGPLPEGADTRGPGAIKFDPPRVVKFDGGGGGSVTHVTQKNTFHTEVTVPPGTTDPHGIASGVGPALAPHVAAAHRDALQSQTVP